MARFCIEDYKNPNYTNSKDQVHGQLTNYSINKLHKDFKYDVEDAHKKLMTDVWTMMASKGHDVEQIWEDIKELTRELMNICHPYLYHYTQLSLGNKAK